MDWIVLMQTYENPLTLGSRQGNLVDDTSRRCCPFQWAESAEISLHEASFNILVTLPDYWKLTYLEEESKSLQQKSQRWGVLTPFYTLIYFKASRPLVRDMNINGGAHSVIEAWLPRRGSDISHVRNNCRHCGMHDREDKRLDLWEGAEKQKPSLWEQAHFYIHKSRILDGILCHDGGDSHW